MCGIFGYVGGCEATLLLLEGLKRLEYRGYDSAGLALHQPDGGLFVRKSPGKIRVLEGTLEAEKTPGSSGIAHTRWATHGAPTRANAHPHLSGDGRVAVVHNGIVENAFELRPVLEDEGFAFQSETDTEVFAHLFDRELRQGVSLETAVARALRSVRGTYGIAVISSADPGKIVVARNGSPLLLGVGGAGECFVSSDAAALAPHVRHVIYLRDGDCASLSAEGYRTFDADRRSVHRRRRRLPWDPETITKGGYDHFMQKEIHAQPESLRDVIRGRLLEEEGSVRLGGLREGERELAAVKRIIVTACGTSWHAGLIGARMIEETARIPAITEYASEFRYRNPVLDEGTLIVAVSQSGETADTLAAAKEARRRGCPVMGIVNVVGSAIARETDFGMYLHAGPEIGVASTKAFTSQIVAFALFTTLLARRGSMSVVEGRKLVRALRMLPDQMAELLSSAEGEIKRIAKRYQSARNALYLGRGYHFPVALEGALKLKEVSYIHAEGYPAAEMKHGPIALIDEEMPVVCLAPGDEVYRKTLSNIQEVRARGGRVIAIVDRMDPELVQCADETVLIPRAHPLLAPVLATAPLQLLAYHIATMRGCDVDQPRNLAKSVTVE